MLLYGIKQYFIGLVRYFDINADFGYIISNKCNMQTENYNQEFYVKSSSFIEDEARQEGCVVLFQIEIQTNGKKRAVNVRKITNSSDDVNLALQYYGEYDYVEDENGRRINLYNSAYLPINKVVENVQSIIEKDEERSLSRTVDHLVFLIENYAKKINGEYIFDKHYFTEYRSTWKNLFSILNDEECVEILKIYPSAVRYINDEKVILVWLKEKLTEHCTLSDILKIEKIFDYIPDNCVEYAQNKIESIADNRIKVILNKLSQRSDVCENDFEENNSDICKVSYEKEKGVLLEGLLSYLKLTTKTYSDEKRECLYSAKKNRFKNELDDFISENSEEFKSDFCARRFLDFLKSLPQEEFVNYEGALSKKITHLLDVYIEKKRYQDAAYLIGHIRVVSGDYLSFYKEKLLPLVIKFLLDLIKDNINNAEFWEIDFLNIYNSLTFIYDDNQRTEIKRILIQILKDIRSVEALSAVSIGEACWLDVDYAIDLAQELLYSWNFETIETFIEREPNVFNNNSRFTKIIKNRVCELIACIPIKDFFAGSFKNVEGYTCRDPERFLKKLKTFVHNRNESFVWREYLGDRTDEELLMLYEKGIIDVDEYVVKGIINSISLKSFCAAENRWYEKPELQNKVYKNVLESTSTNLFPIIGERLKYMDLSAENIPLAIVLVELLACNKFQECVRWEEELKKISIVNPRLSVIFWAVYFQTKASISVLAEIFADLPPYIQIRCLKKLFQLKVLNKIRFSSSTELYELINKGNRRLCLPVEIIFEYLKLREKDSSATFDNKVMLGLLNGRGDHPEWIGIRHFVTQCYGRWNVRSMSYRERSAYYNGCVEDKGDGGFELFVPKKMIDINGRIQNYNNKYYYHIVDLIKLTYSDSNYDLKESELGKYYYFHQQYVATLFSIARSFNIKFNAYRSLIDFENSENNEECFCECRMSDKLDYEYGVAFNWCNNKPCFCPPIRYKLPYEWEYYTLLDFMRILDIPTDCRNREGKIIKYGYYIIFSSYLKSFAKFYEHLKCRSCGDLMSPTSISNYAYRAVTKFVCSNEQCDEKWKLVYLNHCFNRPKCDTIIDSRDSKQCPNGHYICPVCGACCSTEKTRQRIYNLEMNGICVSEKETEFVRLDLGHWEKKIFYCHKCGELMESNSDNTYLCKKCKTKYNHS